ncbi:MAG: polymerase sigma factor, sigma-70 family [Clostridiales bacterium]|jgi:RNA polymerase sigma-70 factor (ECF subfamily)|nr:polymerase sigma factor, sigma-70 family [Clostridiales bacterium]
MDIADMVNKALSGDKEALIQLVMNKKSEYYKLAYVYMGNKDDAMDAMEDMILILYENIKRLKNPDAFYSWSKTILVNCCKSIMRKNKRIIPVSEYAEIEYVDNFDSKEHGIDIVKAMKKLNKHQQEAIKLRYFLDMDYERISVLTNTPVGTVKSRISIGLKKLKEVFGGEYNG